MMPISDRSHALIQKYFEALATEAELAELEGLLASDPEVAGAFAEVARLHAGLQDYFRKQYKIDQVASLLDSSDALPLSFAAAAALPAESADRTDADPVIRPSDSAFIPVPRHLIGTRRKRFRFVVPALRWRWITAAALALMVTIGAWSWWGPVAPGPQLVSGPVLVAGRGVTELPDNTLFEVGNGPAVIGFPGGGRVELRSSTRAMIRRSNGRFVLTLVGGGGDFQVPKERPELSIETVLGVVTTPGGRYSLELVTALPAQLSSTENLRLPRLAVVVAQGAVTVEYAGAAMTLSAGEQHVFFNPT